MPKSQYVCGICDTGICKKCEVYFAPESFAFLEQVPEEFNRAHYCPDCFEEKLVPFKENYDALMDQAKEVNIFFIADKHLPPILKKANQAVKILDCRDRDEVILRLGFRAAEQGYNSVIKVDVLAKQFRQLTHQKSIWQATGIPANIDVEKYFRNKN